MPHLECCCLLHVFAVSEVRELGGSLVEKVSRVAVTSALMHGPWNTLLLECATIDQVSIVVSLLLIEHLSTLPVRKDYLRPHDTQQHT